LLNNANVGQLIFVLIVTVVAVSCQTFRQKYTQFYFGWGSTPDPAGGLKA